MVAIERIEALTTNERVVPGAAEHGRAIVSGREHIVASVHRIVAGIRVERVVASRAKHRVAVRSTGDQVLIVAAVEKIRAASSIERVVSGTSIDRVRSVIAHELDIAVAAVD
jgi:hypothetical protein